MEIKKGLILLVLCATGWAFGQDTTNWSNVDSVKYPKPRLLRAAAGFEMGLQHDNTKNAYVTLNMEYLPVSFVGVRGDLRFFINATGDRPRWKMNHQVLAGVSFNIPNRIRLLPVFFLQPGIAFTQSSEYFKETSSGADYEIALTPVLSMGTGLQYYAPKIFHAFIEMRYTIGQHMVTSGSTYLDELSFSFGLGAQLYIPKKEKKRVD